METALKRKTKDFNPNNCPVTHCLNVIGGKWKGVLLHLIRNGCNRYSMLQRAVPSLSKQSLTNQLRELEQDGVICRTIFAEIPPRVEYYITPLGQSLLPLIDGMRAWGLAHMDTPPCPAPSAGK